MKFKKEYLFLGTAIILIFFGGYLFFSKPLSVRFVDVKFEVANKLGIILNESELDFGILSAGSSSSKEINVGNEYDFPVRVELNIDKNLKNFVFSESKFIISVGEVSVVPFMLVLPNDALSGNYSGKIRFEFYRAD